jgi:hypothetical protein
VLEACPTPKLGVIATVSETVDRGTRIRGMRSTLTRAFDPIAGGKRPPEERAEDLEDEGTRGGRDRVTSGNRPQRVPGA